jgi:hypothetical protein
MIALAWSQRLEPGRALVVRRGRAGRRGAGAAGTNGRELTDFWLCLSGLVPSWALPVAVYAVPRGIATAVAPPAQAGRRSSPSR